MSALHMKSEGQPSIQAFASAFLGLSFDLKDASFVEWHSPQLKSDR
jgi:hypothetical protein